MIYGLAPWRFSTTLTPGSEAHDSPAVDSAGTQPLSKHTSYHYYGCAIKLGKRTHRNTQGHTKHRQFSVKGFIFVGVVIE